MAWSIECLVNTINIPNECKNDLFDEAQDYEGELWDALDRVTDRSGLLRFRSDDMEAKDYLDTHDKVIVILKRYDVEGDICFGSLEGDNAGEFWGYRFDGQGGMKYLNGKIIWEEKKEVLKGKTVVITGTISGMTRQEVEDIIYDAGGKTSDTVSKNTDLLVVGDKPGSKLEKAKKLGIKIISKNDFLTMIE